MGIPTTNNHCHIESLEHPFKKCMLGSQAIIQQNLAPSFTGHLDERGGDFSDGHEVAVTIMLVSEGKKT